MLKTVRISVLVLVLGCSTFAGEIPNGSAPPPPPPPPPITIATEGDEQTNCGDVACDESIENTIAEITLSVLENLLLIF